MKKTDLQILFLAVVGLIIGCSGGKDDIYGKNSISLIHDGNSRNYDLYTPESYTPSHTYPLVVVLHGGFGSPNSVAEYTKWDDMADEQQLIIAYPESLGSQWYDGRQEDVTDDVDFIHTVINDVKYRRAIDGEKVFLTGVSNGGMLTQRIAAQRPLGIAAFDTFIAALPADVLEMQLASTPVSIMTIQGTGDGVMPYEGGNVLSEVGGQVLSSEDARDYFLSLADCTLYSDLTIDPRPEDNSSLNTKLYSCSEGSQQAHLTVIEGGHTYYGECDGIIWIGGGEKNCDFESTETIWNFFDQAD